MSGPRDASLVAEYRREFGSGFHPLKLWRDRRAILAEPVLAARQDPPLANAPVRYALSLSLAPMLFVGWMMSLLVDLAYPDRERAGLHDGLFVSTQQRLGEELPGLDAEAVKQLAGTIPIEQMPASASQLRDKLARIMSRANRIDVTELNAQMEGWIREVQSSELDAAQQRVMMAKALAASRYGEKLLRRVGTMQRSVLEGGPMMQVLGVFGTLLGAWLFGQMVRGDSRFVHAERADRFYLYYIPSRMFWFLPAGALAYGIVSFASATGNTGLMSYAQSGQLLVAGGALLYLLLHARDMARALCDAAPAPRGVAFAVAWRLLAAQAVAMVAIVLVTFLLFAAAVALYAALN
jgi:hypothetical protein